MRLLPGVDLFSYKAVCRPHDMTDHYVMRSQQKSGAQPCDSHGCDIGHRKSAVMTSEWLLVCRASIELVKSPSGLSDISQMSRASRRTSQGSQRQLGVVDDGLQLFSIDGDRTHAICASAVGGTRCPGCLPGSYTALLMHRYQRRIAEDAIFLTADSATMAASLPAACLINFVWKIPRRSSLDRLLAAVHRSCIMDKTKACTLLHMN